MDINDLRIFVTLASLVLFVALMAHTWSRRRLAEHDEAALLPFSDEPVRCSPVENPSRGEQM